MANTYLTIDMITAEAVMLFKNSNLFIQNMDTQYDDQFAIDGAKIGDTLRIRLPSDFTVTDGPAMQLQDNTQQFTTLTVSSQKNVATPYYTAERTMSIDRYSELIMAPMVNNLCAKVAYVIMLGSEGGVCNLVQNLDGAGNIATPTSDQFLAANAVLDDNGADDMDRRIVNDPTTDARTTTSLQGLLNPTPEISAQFRSGKMKSGLGYARWFRDPTVIKHTTGSYNGAATVNLGGQTTSTSGGPINTTAIVGTLNIGDIIIFANVNAVNRLTKQSLGTLRQFVVTAAVANGGTVVNVYPGLIPSSTGVAGGPDQQYQTVDSSPINGAAMLLVTPASAVYRKSIAYTQKAVTMATADLVMPKRAVEEAARTNYDGISMRVLTDYLPLTDQLATRVDVLFGFRYIRPEWLCICADKV
jgi:P22 coat protein - gene protein 5